MVFVNHIHIFHLLLKFWKYISFVFNIVFKLILHMTRYAKPKVVAAYFSATRTYDGKNTCTPLRFWEFDAVCVQ